MELADCVRVIESSLCMHVYLGSYVVLLLPGWLLSPGFSTCVPYLGI